MTTHLCNWHKDEGSAFTYGVGVPQPDYENAGCILLWGTNPHNTHVRHARDIDAAAARGAKLIVIDPCRIPLAERADAWLRVRPGSDLPLALGLIHRMIAQGHHDADFLSRWTNATFLIREDNGELLTEADLAGAGPDESGADATRFVVRDVSTAELVFFDPDCASYETDTVMPELDAGPSVEIPAVGEVPCHTVFAALKQTVEAFTLEHTSRLTSIPEADIALAADLLGTAGPVCYYSWNGLEQHSDAFQTNRAVCILYSLTGDFDRRGAWSSTPMPRSR